MTKPFAESSSQPIKSDNLGRGRAVLPDQVVIIDDMSTARGGATALALLAARLLAERNIKVIYVTGDDGANPELEALGIEVMATASGRLLKQPKLKSVTTGIYDKKIVRLLDRIIDKLDTPRTVYHLHGWAQTLSPAVFRPLRKVSERCFVHCHDLFLACPNSVFYDFQKSVDCDLKPLGWSCVTTNCDKRSYGQKLWRLTRQTLLRQLFDQDLPWGGIIMIHPKMQSFLEKAGHPTDRLSVVQNSAKAYSNQRIEAEDNDRFAFIGRIEPDKGILEFLKAGSHADVPMTVVGDGPLLAELKAKHPNVRFTGWAGPDQIGGLTTDCRALVMPSRFREPFGLVAVEASLSGLPLIVPNNAFLTSEIQTAKLGFSYEARDLDALTKAMKKMRDASASTIKQMSIKGAGGSANLGQNPDSWIG